MKDTPWIDINHRLPEFDRPVLACIADKPQEACVIAKLEEVRVSETLQGRSVSMDWYEHWSRDRVNPTHWMPLPDAFRTPTSR